MKTDFSSLGYATLSVDSLPEYHAEALHLLHTGSGAQVYKIHADDQENLFSFIFRTPPQDHSGTAHIMEHSVLCGSQRYPMKDPFLILLKGSTHTFLNAITYPDKTVYPAASMVKADFLNLLRVYADAVLFPNLKKEFFEQEGHRLEFDDEGKLVRKGVVFNEMKGSYSSVDSLLGDYSMRSLYPQTAYRWDSGGDPQHIPTLDYATFKAFHRSFYHPSNMRIFLYGNHDTEHILSILADEYLNRFESVVISTDIALQTPWKERRRLSAYYPVDTEVSKAGKTNITMNWLWKQAADPQYCLRAQVLSHILLAHSGSPLFKAIIDSGLGEDLSPVSGLESDLKQMMFSVGLRGTDPDKETAFENLVNETLGKTAGSLDADLIEAALRSVEFRAREIRKGIPFGMRLMKRVLRGWLHDRAPQESLVFENYMTDLRRKASKDLFQNMIRTELLENTHSSTVVLKPQPGLQEQRDREDKEQLEELQNRLSETEKQAIRRTSVQLQTLQNQPDSPEDLARIPFLSLTDLPREVEKIPLDCGKKDEVCWYSHEAFTNGITYLQMAFDLSTLDAELQAWMPLFAHAFTDVGLPGRAHDDVARELAMKSGGLYCSLEAAPIHPSIGGGVSLKLFVHLKALTRQWDEALDITLKLLQAADFSNTQRMSDLLAELRNDYRSAIIPSGHAFAMLRAASKHSMASAWEDFWYGIEQYHYLQAVIQQPDGPEKACRALMSIQKSILRQNNLSLVLSSESLPAVLDKTLAMTAHLDRSAPSENAGLPELFQHESTAEGLAVPSPVSFSALSLPIPLIGTGENAYCTLLAHLLRTGYLWEHIRMRGGAYGASASVSALEGLFNFSTYRDPVILPSLEAFRKSLDWSKTLDTKTVEMGIIAIVGKELKPMGPGLKGSVAFKRKLYGIDDDMRQERRDMYLSGRAADIAMAAQILIDGWDNQSVSVIAGKKALNELVGSPGYSSLPVIDVFQD